MKFQGVSEAVGGRFLINVVQSTPWDAGLCEALAAQSQQTQASSSSGSTAVAPMPEVQRRRCMNPRRASEGPAEEPVEARPVSGKRQFKVTNSYLAGGRTKVAKVEDVW